MPDYFHNLSAEQLVAVQLTWYSASRAMAWGDVDYIEARDDRIALVGGSVLGMDDAVDCAKGSASGCFWTVVTFVPVGKLSRTAKAADLVEGIRGGEKTMALARDIGKAGEEGSSLIARLGKNTTLLEDASVFTTKTGGRIPDVVAPGMIGEVKNVSYLPYSRQLREYASYASKEGLGFQLEVSASTRLSVPLLEAINRGEIKLVNGGF